uniref:Uncharacterized protein n=1 Tax=Avena sativa TaxID=4498 RepID=A0ACD5TV30_AVESA
MEFQGQRDNPANRVDEHGNPFPLAGHNGGMGAAHAAPGAGGQFQPSRGEHKTGGILHRSGSSSSSSSSEDDGMGGRRKKGMKEKIKEKLPGGGHKDNNQQQHMAAGTGGAYGQQHTAAGTGAYGQQGMTGATAEKKGFMDKIKEKLPGQH